VVDGPPIKPRTKGVFVYENRWDQRKGRYFVKHIEFVFKLQKKPNAVAELKGELFSSDAATWFTASDVVKEIRLYQLE
jgi:hypothetical protein